MAWILDKYPEYVILIGIVIVVASMLRLTYQRIRKNAEKERQRETVVRAAQDAERKQRLAAAIPKSKVSSPKTRVPLGDSLGTPFAGNVQGIAAKWETEVHQIGCQIIGQIDCKMAALQAITLDANRTANRLEILIEHLEQIARKQIEWQQQLAEVPPTVISAAELLSKATPLTDVLQEFSVDLKGIRNTIQESATLNKQSATILRLPEPQETTPAGDAVTNLRGEVEMLLNYGLKPQEIARQLNISLGEVDLVLQIQQNRLGRTDTHLDAASP